MAIIKRSTTTIIGLDTELAAVNLNITAEANARQAADGVLTSLTTTAKGNLVAAINEVKASVDTEVSTRQAKIGTLSVNTVTSLAPNATKGNGFGTWGTVNNYTDYDVTSALNTLFSAAVTEANERVSLGDNLQQQITNILSNTDATALNSLSELVTAFQAADNNLNLAITTLADTASTNLSNEVTARTNADTEIKNALVAYANHVKTTVNTVSNSTYSSIASGLGTVANFVTKSFVVQEVAVANGPYLEIVVTNTESKVYTETASYNNNMRLRNFSSIRTIVDGQAYDLSANVMVKSVSPGSSDGYPLFVVDGLSASDLTFFSGKTFTIEFDIAESVLLTHPITSASAYNYALANQVTGIKSINTGSTPWGALV